MVVLISASLDVYLKPWATQHGIDQVCATQLETRGPLLTGEIEGRNCRGREKVRRAKEVIGSRSFETISAYGDNDGDREMLDFASDPHKKPFRAPGYSIRKASTFTRLLML